MKQVQELQNSFQSVLRELNDTQSRLEQVQAASVRLVDIVARQQGNPLPRPRFQPGPASGTDRRRPFAMYADLLGPNYRTFDPAEFAYLQDTVGRRATNSSPSIFVSTMPEFNVNVTDFSMLAAPVELASSTRSISADGLSGLPSSAQVTTGQTRRTMPGLSHDKPGPARSGRPVRRGMHKCRDRVGGD